MKDVRNFLNIFILPLVFFIAGVATAGETPTQTIADIKTQLISTMEKDGYLSQKMANEVAQKYITEQDKNTISKPISRSEATIEQTQENVKAKDDVTWTEYFSWINFIKVISVICLLVAFSGIIGKIVVGMWVFIAAVPVIVYQLAFLAAGLVGVLRPDLIWESQAFYIALFAAFANIGTVSWIVTDHKKLQEFIRKIFNLGIPVSCVISFYGMMYFAALAFAYESSIFGFFAAVCLSGVFSFSLYYSPGVLFLNFKENMMGVVVIGHMIVLGLYIAFFKDMPQAIYFDDGIQYYCTIAMGVGLLVGASPFYRKDTARGYAVLFIALFFVATYGYQFWDVKAVASIIFVFFVLFILEWIGYIGYHTGAIVGSTIVGASLYATAMMFEKYGSMLILTLNS